jgi:glycosyltransferase involved in cell wall biosynthesis
MVEISVVIPTFNRIEILPEVLAALGQQEGAPPFEVVVVDDGSSDGTWDLLAGYRAPYRLEVARQENAGPARARNRGVELSSGRRVAFLGDDTVPSKGWLRAHQRAAERHAGERLLGVIGYTGWHPRMKVDPFLRYINEYGLQFGYALIEDRENVPFNFLYTSNLSLPREALLEEPFDLRFPYPAWEDTELGYRLKERGLKLVYEPAALVQHDHPTRLGRFMARQEKAGYSAVVFYRLHPELGGFLGLSPEGPPPPPPAWRQQLMEKLASALQVFHLRTPTLWESVLRGHYIAGLHRGWADHLAGKFEFEPIRGEA